MPRNSSGEGEYGVRYSVFSGKRGNGPATIKEKWFSTKKAREIFANKIEQHPNFYGFVAWSDPKS